MTLAGGTIVVNAGGDGIDSNGAMNITGGTVVVNGPTNGANAALDTNGTFLISGGTVMAVGASGMVETPSTSSPQGWVAYNFTAVQPAGTIVHIATTDGTDLIAFEAAKEFQAVIFSSDQITMGQDYDVYTGGSGTGSSTAGLYTSGTLTDATKVSSVTSGVSTGGGMNNGGGMMDPRCSSVGYGLWYGGPG